MEFLIKERNYVMNKKVFSIIVAIIVAVCMSTAISAASRTRTLSAGGFTHTMGIDITSVRGVASISSFPATSDVYTAVYIYCNGNDGVTYNANDNGYGGYNAASVTASGCTFVSASAHYWLYTSTHPLSEIYQAGTISV